MEMEGAAPARVTPGRIFALLAVPLLWGSFTPSMKLVLNDKHQPPSLLTNLLSHVIGSAVLVVFWLIQFSMKSRSERMPKMESIRASAELGLYLFFGQLTQLVGLKGTSATTNAILVQASVIVVPLIDTIGWGGSGSPGVRILLRLLPSVLALFGVVLLTVTPGTSLVGSVTEDDWLGIAFSLVSAVCYAMHTLRLSAYGDVEATTQAAGQVVFNALLDLLAMPFSLESRVWLFRAGSGPTRHLFMAAVWNGVVVVGATTWAMSYAQQAFSASSAALAYAMEPLCAAILAVFILGEVLAPLQMLGGVLVILANLIAARNM
mmetsp:Transcript_6696/g.20262  ORF Transcript_6696/g.20262 Transcript_6696/m.20262 type:complete len:320 (-) Transcript_6696:324-1283(-)